MNEQGLVRYRETIGELQQVSKMFADSGYFQDARSMAQAFVKIQTGREMGIPPMAAMTGIAIIQGKPVVGANIIASKVKSSGYDYRVRKLDNEGCNIEFFSKTGESLGFSGFNKEDAVAAGLLGKDNWKKYARNMYFARAISNGQRWYCPDATSGTTVYTPDELGGKVDDDGNPIVDAQGKAVIDAEFTEVLKPEPALTLEESEQMIDRRRHDIDAWCLEMCADVYGVQDEAKYKELLKEASTFIGKKDGKEHYAESIADITGKTWTNLSHHRAKEMYEAWKNQ